MRIPKGKGEKDKKILEKIVMKTHQIIKKY